MDLPREEIVRLMEGLVSRKTALHAKRNFPDTSVDAWLEVGKEIEKISRLWLKLWHHELSMEDTA